MPRRTLYGEAAIEAYAASITAKGSLPNLVVEPEFDADGAATGFNFVTIGEARRLAQLLRVKRKEMRAGAQARGARLNTLKLPTERMPRAMATAERLAEAVSLDMISHWASTVRTHLGRITKATFLPPCEKGSATRPLTGWRT